MKVDPYTFDFTQGMSESGKVDRAYSLLKEVAEHGALSVGEYDECYCIYCHNSRWLGSDLNPSFHQQTCLWLRIKEWVDENPR